MRNSFGFAASIMAVVAFSIADRASAQCDEVLKHGIFNEVHQKSDQGFMSNFNQWIYDMDFRTHDEAIKAGLSVGMVIYGLPLQIGGTFDKNIKDTWRREHAEYKNNSVSTSKKYSLMTKTVSSDVMKAWTECIKTRNLGLNIYAMEVGKDVAKIVVTWRANEGDTGAKPKVKKSNISGGVRSDDNLAVAFDAGHEFLATDNITGIKRVHGEPLAVVIQTTRGDVAVSLPAEIDKPEIAEFTATPSIIDQGAATELKWKTSKGTQITIDNGIGSVSSSDSIKASPASSVTYTLTATNEGGSVTRATKVEVKPLKFVSMVVYTNTTHNDKDKEITFTFSVSNNVGGPGDVHGKKSFGFSEVWADNTVEKREFALDAGKEILVSDINGYHFSVHYDSSQGDPDWWGYMVVDGITSDGKTVHLAAQTPAQQFQLGHHDNGKRSERIEVAIPLVKRP